MEWQNFRSFKIKYVKTFLFIFIISCNSSHERDAINQVNNNYQEFYYHDGSIKQRILLDENNNRIVNCYYPNGNIRSILEFKDGKLWNIIEYKSIFNEDLDYGNFSNGSGSLKIYNYDSIPSLFLQGQIDSGYKVGYWTLYSLENDYDSILYKRELFDEVF